MTPNDFNRHGPTTAGGGFSASVGGPVIFTLGKGSVLAARTQAQYQDAANNAQRGNKNGSEGYCSAPGEWFNQKWILWIWKAHTLTVKDYYKRKNAPDPMSVHGERDMWQGKRSNSGA